MTLSDWAVRWAIPPAAMDDLRAQMGMAGAFATAGTARTGEAAVQSAVRLEAAQKGVRLDRVLVCEVRAGLAGVRAARGGAGPSSRAGPGRAAAAECAAVVGGARAGAGRAACTRGRGASTSGRVWWSPSPSRWCWR